MDIADFRPGLYWKNIQIGADRDDIMEALGMPTSIYPPRDGRNPNDNRHSVYWSYHNKGIEVEFEQGGRVACVFVYVTDKGQHKSSYKLPFTPTKNVARTIYGPPNISGPYGKNHFYDYWNKGIQFQYDSLNNITDFCICREANENSSDS